MPSSSGYRAALRHVLPILVIGLVVTLGVLWPTAALAYLHVGEDFREDPSTPGRFDVHVDGKVFDQRDLWRNDVPFFGDQGLAQPIRDLEPDLLRLQRLMQQPTQAIAALASLETATNALVGQGLQPAAALEQALGAIEAKHYFPDSRVVALGILSTEKFIDLPATGFVLTDVGAGLRHGELAHRLQWAMIMHDFEQAPDEWTHTPFELFTKIGELDQKLATVTDPTGKLKNPNVWAHLFDQAGIDSDEVEKQTRNTPGNIVKADGFRHPDRLTDAMVLGFDAGNPMPKAIADGVRQRYEQRQEAYNRVQQANGWNDTTIEMIIKTNDAVAAELKATLVADNYREWTDPNLLIHDDDRAQADAENARAKEVRIKLARRFWKQEPPVFSPQELAKATELGQRHILLQQTPKPPATPLPAAVAGPAAAPVPGGQAVAAPPPPPPPPSPGQSIADAGPTPDDGGKQKRPRRHTR